MNLKSCRLSLLIFAAWLSAFGCAAKRLAPENAEATERKIIFVKIPPVLDEKLSEEERYWQIQKFLFPQLKIPHPLPPGLPHDHSFLYIKLEADGVLKLNGENQESAETLQKRLVEIFRVRAEKGVFEPDSEKVLKAVVVGAPLSAKYWEVFTLFEHVENSGADPIFLQLDELPTAGVVSVR